jgi:hypothetical protein
MNRGIVNCQNTDEQTSQYSKMIEAYILRVFAGYIKVSDCISLHRQHENNLGSLTIEIVSGNNHQHSDSQKLNLSEEQSTNSDSLTMRAIQAFIDTEDEWAGVYANLAKH